MSPRKRPPDPWPWPADTPLERARRVAQTYRLALAEHAGDTCARLDRQMQQAGQTWVVPTPEVHDDDDLLTTELAADYLQVRPRTVDEYRRRGLPRVATPDGPRYRVGDLRAWRAHQRRARTRQAGTSSCS